ncbi:pilus assembly protein TadG-related protein [Yoonia sp.]|uniref:pilus assembly protein TadG-related protein n=1 Tax=Yoonia sp. TaxID=2212373 RepID=UPI003A4E3B7D
MKAQTARFRNDQDGSATVLGLFFFLMSAVVLGLALDNANGWRIKTQMQVATDAAALAGAANLNDRAKARELALQVANMNLPTKNAITIDDIFLGHIDRVSLEFVAGADEAGVTNAVAVDGSRTMARANAVPTYLLKFVGMNTLDVQTRSVAAAQLGMGGGGFAGCQDAMFYSEANVSIGGGYRMNGGVCVHASGITPSGGTVGGSFVHSGGNEVFNPEVRLSAPDINRIFLGNSYQPRSLPREEIMVERHMEAALLPQLNTMYSNLWSALWTNAPTTYAGNLLPEFMVGNGPVPVVRVSGYWNAMTQDFGWNGPVLQPNHIYVVDGNVGIASGVSVENVAIITNGSINVSGGGGTTFNNVFFFSRGDNGGSNAAVWGPSATDFCSSTDYTVHLFSRDGTVTAGNRMSGVLAAGNRINLGGGWTGSGVYFEARDAFQMGGGFTTTACDDVRQSEYTLIDPATEEEVTVGSFLYR